MKAQRCDRCQGILTPINGRPAQGHFPGCFHSNRVVSVRNATKFEPIVVTKQQQELDARKKAWVTVEDFIGWMFRGQAKIPTMSPKRVLEILRNDSDVRELLGQQRVNQIRSAAEILSS